MQGVHVTYNLPIRMYTSKRLEITCLDWGLEPRFYVWMFKILFANWWPAVLIQQQTTCFVQNSLLLSLPPSLPLSLSFFLPFFGMWMTLGYGLLQLAIGSVLHLVISHIYVAYWDSAGLWVCSPWFCTIAEGDRVSCAESSRGKRKRSIVREGKELRGKEWEQTRIKRGVELATVFRN